LTIVLGLLAAIVFPSLDTLEIALLAEMLAPTDAAFDKPVVRRWTIWVSSRGLLRNSLRMRGMRASR
jgi:NhaP-type Na+/H+ or K+/H+ antiporter